MTLDVADYDNCWRRFTLTECPLCGHEFDRNERREGHFEMEHGPEDAGLSPLGERPEGVNEPLFTPVADLLGGDAGAE